MIVSFAARRWKQAPERMTEELNDTQKAAFLFF
jgi:hypothetical protein